MTWDSTLTLQGAVHRASTLKTWLHFSQAVCLVCIVFHYLKAARQIPGMAVILDALSQSIGSLATLLLVMFVLLTMSAGLLLISDPQSEALTRADYLAGFMFTSTVVGMLALMPHCPLAMIAYSAVGNHMHSCA